MTPGSSTTSGGGVAVVAAALRLPGASSLDEYWRQLLAGVDCISRADDAGAPCEPEPPRGPGNARYVAAYGGVVNTLAFDPQRFGMSPAEAMQTDPQQRLLLELADEALHSAALPTSARRGAAVFVGTGLSDYGSAVRRHQRSTPGVDETAVELGTARDYVAGKLSYRLDLHGPAVNVLSACSTALVCVHLACRSLELNECDAAVAGVAALRFPEQRGYWAVPGSISAVDGFCRPFDARASGTVPADGAGVVVLKRLEDALATGDNVLAVLRGSAVNNDGAKVGFASVSAASQEAVIVEALRCAELSPDDIRYVESHGTGTRLGDAVEWAALQKVFGGSQTPTSVGAVKGNIGHTREAAGMAGLLKAVLSLRRGWIPATANFHSLARDLEYPDSQVQPVATATALNAAPECAVGVSAFGLGGTNCHVVLGPAPVRERRSPNDHGGILFLSSHRDDTLAADTEKLRSLVDEDPDYVSALARDSRRRHHGHRFRRYVSITGGATTEAFSGGALARQTQRVPRRPPPLAFAFSGLGSEYLGMGSGLARRFEVFRRSRDGVIEMAAACGVDIAEVGVPAPRPTTGGTDLRRLVRGVREPEADTAPRTSLAVDHLALFAYQVAFTDLLAAAGVRPAAVVGHSLGEWTAATVAETLPLAEAVRWIALRAQLIEQAPAGVTLAVAAGRDVVVPRLAHGLSIVADNSPKSCSVSGSPEAVELLETELRDDGIVFRRLRSKAAFHNTRLSDAAHELRRAMSGTVFRPPILPIASCVSGQWIGDGGLDERYWETQLVAPVRFQDALRSLAERYELVLEIGPGSLGSWVTHTGGRLEAVRTCPLAYEGVEDADAFEQALAELWLRGYEPSSLFSSSPQLPASLASPSTPVPPTLAPSLRRTVFDPRSAVASGPLPGPSAVRDPARAGEGSGPLPSPPAAPIPEPRVELVNRLAVLWCALLGVPEVSPEEHFFDLGGDSLLGRHLIAQIQDMYGLEVPASVVFGSGSLRGMATSIHEWISAQPDGRI